MYLIANISNSEIVIADLGIKLMPHQSIDIHKIDPNLKPENSENLKLAIHKGFIKLLHQSNAIVPPSSPVVQQAVSKNDLEKKDISELRDEILELKKQIAQIGNNAEILAKLNELVLKTENTGKTSGNTLQIPEKSVKIPEKVEDADIDLSRMVDIHQRGLKKMSKNVGGKVQFDHTSQVDKNVSKNISELEGLI